MKQQIEAFSTTAALATQASLSHEDANRKSKWDVTGVVFVLVKPVVISDSLTPRALTGEAKHEKHG